MLPPFIIEQIRKREEQQDHQRPQPVVEAPIAPKPARDRRDEDPGDRGVVIIDLM